MTREGKLLIIAELWGFDVAVPYVALPRECSKSLFYCVFSPFEGI